MTGIPWSDYSISVYFFVLSTTYGMIGGLETGKVISKPTFDLNPYLTVNEIDPPHTSTDGGANGTEVQRATFGTSNNTVVTAQTGSTAVLPCKIANIGGGIVSWIRRKDYHLLTVGVTTYSSDERFQAVHFQHSEDWTLHIKYLQKRDEGVYECQVSSHPPMSIFINLNIVEARAHISGPAEKYLKPGSALQLQCVILKTTEEPSYVFWYHNDRMINYDTDRGVNVTTDFSQRISDLNIVAARTWHTGNYSCVPNNARPAKVVVHIFNGENPAAMQSSSPALFLHSSISFLYINVIVIIFAVITCLHGS